MKIAREPHERTRKPEETGFECSGCLAGEWKTDGFRPERRFPNRRVPDRSPALLAVRSYERDWTQWAIASRSANRFLFRASVSRAVTVAASFEAGALVSWFANGLSCGGLPALAAVSLIVGMVGVCILDLLVVNHGWTRIHTDADQ